MKESSLQTINDVLDKIPMGPFYYLLIVTCGILYMSDSTEINLFTYLTVCSGVEWNLSQNYKASISTVVLIGELLGSLFFSALADSSGRRPSCLVGCIIMVIFSWLSGVAPNYWCLIICRFFVGFGVGVTSIPFHIVVEFMPTELRGAVLSGMRFFWTLGGVIISCVAWLTIGNGYDWRILVYLCAIPVTISSFLIYLYIPESPRWLISEKKYHEAEIVLKNAAKINKTSIPNFTLMVHDNYDYHASDGDGGTDEVGYDDVEDQIQKHINLVTDLTDNT